jgi:hypothetical protein
LIADPILLGHPTIKAAPRYLGIEVDTAIEIAEKIDIQVRGALPSIADAVAAPVASPLAVVPMAASGIDR